MSDLEKFRADSQVDTCTDDEYKHGDTPHHAVDSAINFGNSFNHGYFLPF
jgi:hypothetical protein